MPSGVAATPKNKKKTLDDDQLQKALGSSGRCLDGQTLTFDQYIQANDLMKLPKSKQDESFAAYIESRRKQEAMFEVMKEPKTYKSVAQLQQAVDERFVKHTKSPYPTRRSESISKIQITEADLNLYNEHAARVNPNVAPQTPPSPPTPEAKATPPGKQQATKAASPPSQATSPISASSPTSATSPTSPRTPTTSGEANKSNWSEGLGQGTLMVPFLLLVCPFLCQLLAYITSPEANRVGAQTAGLTGLCAWAASCSTHIQECLSKVLEAGFSSWPTLLSVQFVAGFAGLALVLDALPGPDAEGPPTGTGHVPVYRDNGFYFCIVFCSLFAIGSLGLGWFDFGIIYDEFPGIVATLNITGLVFAAFLTFKGLYFPSTADSGSTGSLLVDYWWGTELYPRVWGIDIKRFINCRFAMTLWMLSGLSYCYRSYKMRGDVLDYGLFFSALSQFLYLVKFFIWEIGYLRSIDIISDRAGVYVQWGCLVWVPSIYTMNTRYLVQSPSDLPATTGLVLFVISLLGVYFNFIADRQRQLFREIGPEKMMIWGKKPVYVEATYVLHENGKPVTKKSNLLASGWWGPARHFHYVFELTAAWSWCILANPAKNGIIVLVYAIFLTILLFHRAKRDEVKCRLKYGADFEKFCTLGPYLVIPGIW